MRPASPVAEEGAYPVKARGSFWIKLGGFQGGPGLVPRR